MPGIELTTDQSAGVRSYVLSLSEEIRRRSDGKKTVVPRKGKFWELSLDVEPFDVKRAARFRGQARQP